ncbi:MAG: putative amidohydrolase [Myxococcota bacterium]
MPVLPVAVAEITATARDGAALVLLPECATTGFHRGLPAQCSSRGLTDAASVLRRVSDQLGVAVVVGSPWPHDGGFLNAVLVIRPRCVGRPGSTTHWSPPMPVR